MADQATFAQRLEDAEQMSSISGERAAEGTEEEVYSIAVINQCTYCRRDGGRGIQCSSD
jgi:hypothetical protein